MPVGIKKKKLMQSGMHFFTGDRKEYKFYKSYTWVGFPEEKKNYGQLRSIDVNASS